MKNTSPKTNQQRSQARREAEDRLANALGFQSWRRMTTFLKQAHMDRKRISIQVGSIRRSVSYK